MQTITAFNFFLACNSYITSTVSVLVMLLVIVCLFHIDCLLQLAKESILLADGAVSGIVQHQDFQAILFAFSLTLVCINILWIV